MDGGKGMDGDGGNVLMFAHPHQDLKFGNVVEVVEGGDCRGG